MHHLIDRITHTMAFVTPVVGHWLEREIAQWVHHEGSIQWPIASGANALTTELHLALASASDDYIIDILYTMEILLTDKPVVECPLMVHRVVGPIPHGWPIELFLVPASVHNWCNKCCGMCCPAGMMEPIEGHLLVHSLSHQPVGW